MGFFKEYLKWIWKYASCKDVRMLVAAISWSTLPTILIAESSKLFFEPLRSVMKASAMLWALFGVSLYIFYLCEWEERS